MADHTTADLRNIAIVGHGSAGKTTLAEAILFQTGATTRLGKPGEGASISDADVEERERQFSVHAALLCARHAGKTLQLIDTPGYDDFFGEVATTLPAVETALVAIAADAGIRVNTRRCWQAAGEMGLARAIVVTKLDAENAKFPELLAAVQATFGSQCVPVTLPVGQGPGFRGVVNTLAPPADVPDGVLGDVAAVGQALREQIIEADEALMMRYLDEEEIAPEEIMAAAVSAVAGGSLVPVFVCAAERGVGVGEMLDALVSLVPSPAEGLVRRGMRPAAGPDAEPEEVERPADAPFSAQVFKTLYDPFVGKLAYFRVRSGALKADDGLFNVRTGKREKVGHLFRVQGPKQEEVDSAVAGDLVAVAKIDSLEVSDTLCDPSDPVIFPAIAFPTPMVSRAAEPRTRGDDQRMSTALARIASQDKTFLAERDPQTGELIITGMSDLHLTVVISKLRRKPFEVEMDLKDPRIPYKETIAATATATYRHKKQTGGRGQFAEVHLRVEPLERGAGFEFLDEIRSAAIPNQFIPAVEKGVRETMGAGVVAGYPVVDIRVAVYDGKHHSVDSSEAAFKIASSRAFSDAVRQARPQLLEPIVDIEITLPTKHMGDISGDLSGRRGRIQGMDTQGDYQIIQAQVPLAEIANYSTQLRSMTGGEGSYTLEFSHYDPVPRTVQAAIIAKSGKKTEQDD